MPRLKPFNLGPLSDPALQDKLFAVVERELRELADLAIGMGSDALKRRLAQRRSQGLPPASPASRQDWNGRVHAPGAPAAASPYQVLGIAPEASDEEVEKAFRQRVMACHPDRGGDEAELRVVLAAIQEIRRERKG